MKSGISIREKKANKSQLRFDDLACGDYFLRDDDAALCRVLDKSNYMVIATGSTFIVTFNMIIVHVDVEILWTVRKETH